MQIIKWSTYSLLSFPPFQKDLPICDPSQQECIARVAQEEHGCLVKCDGLYADVRHMEDANKLSDRVMYGDNRLLHMLKDGNFLFLYFNTFFLIFSCE